MPVISTSAVGVASMHPRPSSTIRPEEISKDDLMAGRGDLLLLTFFK